MTHPRLLLLALLLCAFAGCDSLPGSSGAGTVPDSVALEPWEPGDPASYLPGTSYFGRNEYVEYVPGTLPLVISAPHGGAMEPAEIPDRSYGTVVTDAYTIETLQAVREAFLARTGQAPHIVISHLRRTKLDPNRELGEAAQGSPYAQRAWTEFQGFIDLAAARIADEYGGGLYLDLHGHGHPTQRLELGYLLSAGDLEQSDAVLDGPAYAPRSSIAGLAGRSSLAFSTLLRGDASLGAFLAEEGVASVPSPPHPSPGGDAYFTGGYNTVRHGSLNGGALDAVQLELHRPGIRDSDANRRAFGEALAVAVEAYMTLHYGFFAGG